MSREQELRNKIEAHRKDESRCREEAERLEKELEALKEPPRHRVTGPYTCRGEQFITVRFPTKEQAEYAKPILEKMNLCPPPFEKDYTIEYWDRSVWGTTSWYGAPWQLRAWYMGELRRKQ